MKFKKVVKFSAIFLGGMITMHFFDQKPYKFIHLYNTPKEKVFKQYLQENEMIIPDLYTQYLKYSN